MDCRIDWATVCGSKGPIVILDARLVLALPAAARRDVYDIIDRMGVASAKAQGLGSAITTGEKLADSAHVLYFALDGRRVLGLLKVGVKKLFIHNAAGAIREISPLCVLDFYVHESCQRSGIGKRLFDYMLRDQQCPGPESLGYDRPSPKLLSFLVKHFGLRSYVPQPNNYVVFEQYFQSIPKDTSRRTTGTASVAERPLTAGRRRVPTPAAAAAAAPSVAPTQSTAFGQSTPAFGRSARAQRDADGANAAAAIYGSDAAPVPHRSSVGIASSPSSRGSAPPFAVDAPDAPFGKPYAQSSVAGYGGRAPLAPTHSGNISRKPSFTYATDSYKEPERVPSRESDYGRRSSGSGTEDNADPVLRRKTSVGRSAGAAVVASGPHSAAAQQHRSTAPWDNPQGDVPPVPNRGSRPPASASSFAATRPY